MAERSRVYDEPLQIERHAPPLRAGDRSGLPGAAGLGLIDVDSRPRTPGAWGREETTGRGRPPPLDPWKPMARTRFSGPIHPSLRRSFLTPNGI